MKVISRFEKGRSRCLAILGAVSISLATTSVFGHEQRAPDASGALLAAYERAAAIEHADFNRSLRNMSVQPRWIGDDTFWYVRHGGKGVEWRVVDAGRRTSSYLFDNASLAAALRKATGKEVDAEDLPVSGLRVLTDGSGALRFSALGKYWDYLPGKRKLEEVKVDDRKWSVSPDGRKAVFLRDQNLWMRNLSDGREKALTEDGQPFYSYAEMPDATGRPAVVPQLIWSPDSRRILTIQTDDRLVKEMPMIEFAPEDGSVRPRAWARRVGLPGDANVATFRMLSIDVETGKQVGANYRPLPTVRMYDTPVGNGWTWWGGDGTLAYFVDIDRGERTARVIEFNVESGETRELFREEADRYLEIGSNVYMHASIVPLPKSNELVWYSERSGWAHLYLYDLANGRMKRQLTSGEWLVRDILGFDESSRDLFITIAGDSEGKDPYYRSIAKVNVDTATLTVLSASDADHAAVHKGDMQTLILAFMGEDTSRIGAVSPTGAYYVETVSTIDGMPRSYVRNADGSEHMWLEEGEVVGLPEFRVPPERVRLTAADGVTQISGVVFRPSDFSSGKKYPVIDFIYGGPQTSFAPESIADMSVAQARALAELGFVVTMIDGRGTVERSRAFHESSYGAVHTASNLEDHIAGIRQLAERYPYMDIDRVGIHGFSGGGYMTAQAMLRFPDFYKVGVAGAGNYDQRVFWHGWGERYHGLPDGDNYLPQATATYADGLKGKLLFIHGLMDHGVHAAALFQLTQALMDANKQFDMLILPRAAHEMPGYAMVRMWDYFVTNLAGETPPAGFSMQSSAELTKAKMKALNETKDGGGKKD